jgi:PrcB C-terminal
MRRTVSTALTALALLTGCAPTSGLDNAMLPVKLLQGSSQCGDLDRPAVIWIATPDAWRLRYERIMAAQSNPPPPPAVDFPREGVVLIAMGQRPTAGYGLSLAETTAAIQDGVLAIRVDWREPPPGYLLAQVITTPCLLVKVPAAAFTRIQVLDQTGRVRVEGVRSSAG